MDEGLFLLLPSDAKARDYFDQLFTATLWDLLVVETNRNAQQKGKPFEVTSMHSPCNHRCVVRWGGHVRCSCVCCLCLAGRVSFSTRAQVQPLYPFYRMTGVNLKRERTWHNILFLPSDLSEPLDGQSSVLSQSYHRSLKWPECAKSHGRFSNKFRRWHPQKISITAATYSLKIPYRTRCCDSFFEALDCIFI